MKNDDHPITEVFGIPRQRQVAVEFLKSLGEEDITSFVRLAENKIAAYLAEVSEPPDSLRLETLFWQFLSSHANPGTRSMGDLEELVLLDGDEGELSLTEALAMLGACCDWVPLSDPI